MIDTSSSFGPGSICINILATQTLGRDPLKFGHKFTREIPPSSFNFTLFPNMFLVYISLYVFLDKIYWQKIVFNWFFIFWTFEILLSYSNYYFMYIVSKKLRFYMIICLRIVATWVDGWNPNRKPQTLITFTKVEFITTITTYRLFCVIF